MLKTGKNIFLMLTIVLSIVSASAQSHIDSLKQKLSYYSNERNDSSYYETLYKLVIEYRNFDVAKSIQYANNGLELAKKTSNSLKMGYWYGQLGGLYVLHDEQLLALEAYHNGLELALENGRNTAWWHVDIGNVYFFDDLNLKKAEKNYLLSIKEFRRFEDTLNGNKGIAVAYNNLGLIQESRNEYKIGVEYYKKALSIRRGINDPSLILHSFSMLANAYMDFNPRMSRECFDSVYSYVQGTSGEFNYYLNISELHRQTKDYKQAMSEIQKAEEIAVEYNLLTFMPLVCKGYTSIYIDIQDYEEAIIHAKSGLIYAKKEQLINYSLPLLQQLIDVYSLTGKYDKAFACQQEYIMLKDSLHVEQVQNAEVNYELEENAKEVNFLKKNLIELTQLEHELEDENKRQHDSIVSFELGLVFVVILGLILLWSFLKQKKQKQLIEENHKEIVSSINYAKTIQKAILPKKDVFDNFLNDYLLISFPKDGLSGDFYQLKVTEKNVVIIVGDCTGHGVPGAMLSVLGISFLNDIIKRKEINSPADALYTLKYHITSNFEDSNKADGMDLALCSISRTEPKMVFAGAYINLYIIRRGEILVYKGTRSSIGVSDLDIPFEDNVIALEKGDRIFMFSDGYPDQIGGDGDKTKKFSKKRLLQILIDNKDQSMDYQKQVLIKSFEDWKKNEEQTDDITVFGMEY